MCMKISNTGVYPRGHGLTTYYKNKITIIFVLHVYYQIFPGDFLCKHQFLTELSEKKK